MTLDNYIQTYSTENPPVHKVRTADDDRVAILFCEILIWRNKMKDKDTPDWWTIDKPLRFTECESVEISKSYKKLISTATIKFPRGMVVGQRIKDSKISTGDGTKEEVETNIKLATQNGELLSDGTSQFEEGKGAGEGTLVVEAFRNDVGIIQVTERSGSKLLDKEDITIGNRIQVRLGYAYSEDEYDDLKAGRTKAKLVFNGFIVKCSVDSPIILECEDMASVLKKIPCPNLKAKGDFTVKNFLDPSGKYYLLKKSGLELDDDTKGVDINIGNIALTNQIVAADMLDEWSKCGLYVFMNDSEEEVKIRVGRVYTSTLNFDQKGVLVQAKGSVNIIQFDWDVASDNLKVMNVDKQYLAVEAHGVTNEGKYFKLTVIKDPSTDNANSSYRVVRRKEISRYKTKKKKTGSGVSDSGMKVADDNVDLSAYTIVPYFTSKRGITQKELETEAWAYYKKYNPNGISGSVTLFGDRDIRPCDTVGLIDPLHPERNGYYFVESVDIKFSASDGYRKELKMPYRVSKYNQEKPIKIERI